VAGFWHGLWSVLWLSTWSNNLAWIEDLLTAALVALVTHKLGILPRLADRLGRRLAAWWAVHHPHNDALAEIREHAEAARRIAADMYERHAGETHPDSLPPKGQ
jgi:hypothetical protein